MTSISFFLLFLSGTKHPVIQAMGENAQPLWRQSTKDLVIQAAGVNMQTKARQCTSPNASEQPPEASSAPATYD